MTDDVEELKRKIINYRQQVQYWKNKAGEGLDYSDFLEAAAQNDRLIAWALVGGGSIISLFSSLAPSDSDTGDIIPKAKPYTWMISPSIAINHTILENIEDMLQGDWGVKDVFQFAGMSAATFGATYLLLSAASGENDQNPIAKMFAGLAGGG